MALEQNWQKIRQLSADLREAVINGSERAESIWAERERMLKNLLNESSLSALSMNDLAWLQEAAEQLQREDQDMLADLTEQQRIVIQTLKKQQGDARAIDAYKKQQG